MKFRKKPVEVEAWQLIAPNVTGPLPPMWLVEAIIERRVEMRLTPPYGALIFTLEGTMRADVGDWIIRGVAGELYPCKPDIFEQTYEQATDGDRP